MTIIGDGNVVHSNEYKTKNWHMYRLEPTNDDQQKYENDSSLFVMKRIKEHVVIKYCNYIVLSLCVSASRS